MNRVITLLLTALILTSCGSVAITGRKQLLVYSDSQITSLAQESYKEFIGTAHISQNKSHNTIVNKVGNNMVKALEKYLSEQGQTNYLKGLNWSFAVVASEEVNAFCMPSGNIVFYEGIMPYANTEDNIAIVMGHEIAHAVARHGNERMSQEALVGTAGGILKGIVQNRGTATSVALFDVAFGVGSQYGILLPYSRKHEYEADRIGLIIMKMAGYDITKAPLFWINMSKNSGASIPEFLSTHPSNQNRINQLNKLVEELSK